MSKLILNKVLMPFRKNYPQLVDDFLLDYAAQSDQPDINKDYFYGINSLKWALMRLTEIDNDAIQHVLYGIILEYNLDILTQHDLQYRILKSYFLRPYRKELSNLPDIPNIKSLPTAFIDGFLIVINDTQHNLTSRIFRHTTADAIVVVNPDTRSAGVILRVNSHINLLRGFKEYLKNTLCKSEPGWKPIGEEENIFLNHGIENKTPTSHTTESLLEIIENYFNK